MTAKRFLPRPFLALVAPASRRCHGAHRPEACATKKKMGGVGMTDRPAIALLAAALLAALVAGPATAQQAQAPAGSIGVQFPADPAENQGRVRAAGLREGVYVQAVAGNSPAARADLRPGDIIVAWNGEPVAAGDDLVRKITATAVGQRVILQFVRAGVPHDVPVVVADRAAVYPAGTFAIDANRSVQLVRDDPNPQIRIAVAHQHTASACFGYLYVDRETIRFEVKWPAKDLGHAFEFPRSALTVARQWTLLATALPEAELKFSAAGRMRSGGTYHFFHVDPSLPENPGAKFEWQNARDWQEIVSAVREFESVAARLRPPPPPEPSKPQTASLQIEAHPGGAEFYIDDEFRGTTSGEGRIKVSDLPPGEHRLRLSKKDYEEWNRTLTLEAGESRTIEVQLAAAKPPEPPPPKPADTTLGLADVLKLLEGGVTPARVESIVKERGVNFTLTEDAESKLRALGATDTLLLAIAKAKK